MKELYSEDGRSVCGKEMQKAKLIIVFQSVCPILIIYPGY